MNRKDLAKEIGFKLQKIRKPLKHPQRKMAERLGAYYSSYSRYENGETIPQATSLYSLGTEFDISLDWLICDKGPMYYKEKETPREKKYRQKVRKSHRRCMMRCRNSCLKWNDTRGCDMKCWPCITNSKKSAAEIKKGATTLSVARKQAWQAFEKVGSKLLFNNKFNIVPAA